MDVGISNNISKDVDELGSPIIVPSVLQLARGHSRNHQVYRHSNYSLQIKQGELISQKQPSATKDFFTHLLPLSQQQQSKKPGISVGAKRILLHKRGLTPSSNDNLSSQKLKRKPLRNSFNYTSEKDNIRLPSISCCLNYSILPKQSVLIKDYISQNQKSAQNTSQIAKLFSKGLINNNQSHLKQSKINRQAHTENNKNNHERSQLSPYEDQYNTPQQVILSKTSPDNGQDCEQNVIAEEEFDQFSNTEIQNKYDSSRLNLLSKSQEKLKPQKQEAKTKCEKKRISKQYDQQQAIASVNWSFDDAFRSMAEEKLRQINLSSSSKNNLALKNVNANYAMEIAQEKMRSFISVWGPQIKIMQRFMHNKIQKTDGKVQPMSLAQSRNIQSFPRKTMTQSSRRPQKKKTFEQGTQSKDSLQSPPSDDEYQMQNQVLSPLSPYSKGGNNNVNIEDNKKNSSFKRLNVFHLDAAMNSCRVGDSINLIMKKDSYESNDSPSNDYSQKLSLSTYMEYINSPQMKNNFISSQENYENSKITDL